MADRDDIRLLEQILHELRAILRSIRSALPPRIPVYAFRFTQENPVQSFAPGTSPAPVITITPLPPNAQLDPDQPVPETVSSDPSNYPISADPTGLLITVNPVAQTAAGFTLTTTYENADGIEATWMSQIFGQLTPQDVTGFSFAQTT